MSRRPSTPRRVARGPAIDWTDEELDALSEIHVIEDTPLMLAFARQYGPARLVDVLTAAREPEPDGDATNAAE